MPEHELQVGRDPGAVPTGRHFTSAALASSCDEDVVDAAELVVTELLTNALLHGAAPVLLVVRAVDDGGARVEVRDASRVLPVRPRPNADGMTGRGLALVDALSADWGVDRDSDGKVVWAQVTPQSALVAEPRESDVDALLASFGDEEDPAPRTLVTLPGVPVDLLLATEAHVDSVVRDLMLAAAGAQSGMDPAVPGELVAQVHDAVREFAEPRGSLKRQATAAAERGEARVDVELRLAPDAEDAARRYLAALEEADGYARAARLLALAARPQHAVFRRWYVRALVARLSSPTAVVPTFEEHLLAEVEHLADLQAVSDRAVRLQGVSAELAGALDHDEVTRIALDAAVAALAAPRGLVLITTSQGLRVGAHVGLPEGHDLSLNALWQAGEGSPATEAAASRRAVWLESPEELVAQFPAFAALEADAGATAAVPLVASGRVVGVLRLSFHDTRLFPADERAFLTALAAVAAQALERADLHDAQAVVADRLLRLQDVASALATARTPEDVLDVTMAHATGLVGARAASVSLLRNGTSVIELVRIAPPLPPGTTWRRFSLEDDLPAAEAIRTGEVLWVPNRAERDARWPAIAGVHDDFEHSFAAVPLQADGAVLGALTVSFPAAQAEPSRDFLRAFADTCAQALQRARSAEAAADAAGRLAFLARASEELSGTLDVETTLGNLARLIVPEVADCCVVHLVQDDALVCVAVEHRDPVKRDLAVAVQKRWPQTLDDPGVGLVMRTGETLPVPSVAAARGEPGLPPREHERQAVLDELGLRSGFIVPLSARGRALGALTFLTGESGREYGPDDLAMAEDLARRAGVAVDNARLYAVAAGAAPPDAPGARGLVRRPRAESMPGHADDALLRWHLAQEAGRLGSWDFDVVTGALTWDEHCATLFGTNLEEFEGAIEGFIHRTHPEDMPRVMALLRETIDTACPLDVEYRVVLPGGGLRHVLSRGRGVPDGDGRVVRVVGAVVDVTELREAASAETRAARILAGLGDVALRLASASTVADVARVVIENGLALLGADGGAVCVRDDEHGTIRLTMTDSLGPDVQLEYAELPLDGPLPGSYTARTGETVLLPTRDSGLSFSPAMTIVYDGTDRDAWASLPLSAGGRLLGSLVVSWAQEREFSPQEQELLAAFAAQCAQALDRIQTLEAERRAARSARRLSETLQRSLLTRPPEPDHLQVAVRYVPASQEAQVGGDWYDAFFTRDQALSLVIGDCTGHDREAVASMAAVRNLLRATAYAVDGPPAAVLTALEQTMAGLNVNALATALLARVEQTEQQRERGLRRLTWSSAGHLPPLLRHADGSTTALTSPPDLMLGLLPSTDRADHSVDLTPGSTLLLYTDGLVERRGEDIDAGIERLHRTVVELGDVPLEELCDALLSQLGDSAEDDVALLAVRFHDEDRPRPAEAGPAYVPDSRPLED